MVVVVVGMWVGQQSGSRDRVLVTESRSVAACGSVTKSSGELSLSVNSLRKSALGQEIAISIWWNCVWGTNVDTHTIREEGKV